MKLTHDNYYSPEANQAYMSVSQFKAFDKCEAAALAELRGEYKPAQSVSMLVGSYVDAFYSGELEAFKMAHTEIFKRDGSLKADYAHAETIIGRINSDRLFRLMITGSTQAIRTGEIEGIPFKCKIDSLLVPERVELIIKEFPDTEQYFRLGTGAIVDLKVMRDFSPIWIDGMRLPFTSAWCYDLQGAIYQAIEGHSLPFFIAAASKETPPDITLIAIAQSDLDTKLREVEYKAPRFQAIKSGQIAPARCEHCAYCRQTKHLQGFQDTPVEDATIF